MSYGVKGYDSMVNLEIVPHMKQSSWGRPAVVNLTLGGAGAGFYLISVLLSFLDQNRFDQTQLVSFQLLAPAIVCCGFLALSLEAGRPVRAPYLLRNLFGSWMSIESLAGGIFIVTVVLHWFLSYFVIKAVAVPAALIFMVSQGFMVYRSPAVTAWNVRLVPVIFTTSGFMTGCGLIFLNTQIFGRAAYLPVMISLICILLNGAVWLLYLYGYRDADFRRATGAMRRFGSLAVIVGAGHLLPLVLLLFIVAYRDFDNGSQLPRILGLISGLALILGGVSQKTGIILKSGYFRSIFLAPAKE